MEEKIRIENVTKKLVSYAALDGISLEDFVKKEKITRNDRKKTESGKTVLFK